MHNYQNILAIIEPGSEKQLALRRALEIARFSEKTKITAFMAVYDFSPDITAILSMDEQTDIRNNIVRVNQEWLEKLLKEYDVKNINIKCMVVWKRNIPAAIMREIKSAPYDLIIKSADEHSFIDTMLFTPTDWQILRHADCPVLIAKDHEWTDGGCILTALNFVADAELEQRLMNIKLFRTAQEISTITNGEIHLVNAVPPILPAAVTDIPTMSPDIYIDAVMKHNRESMSSFATRHSIPEAHCVVKEGEPDEIIPETAKGIQASIVIIGNMKHTGLSAILIGNICERILDYINCDILVVMKPNR